MKEDGKLKDIRGNKREKGKKREKEVEKGRK